MTNDPAPKPIVTLSYDALDRRAEIERIQEAGDQWLETYEERWDRAYIVRGEENRAFWNRTARERYAQRKAERGEEVRTYQKRDRSLIEYEGSYQERRRQMHRDHERERRGKDDNTVRSYTDLSALTEVEKEEHRRRKAAERKREQRKRQRASLAAATPPP